MALRRCSPCLALLLAAGAFGACQSQTTSPPRGECAPTVEGCAGGSYASAEAARSAFTRQAPDGTLTATLEDVAWLRFEGDEDAIVKKHRAYFEQGYTTFEMGSFTKDFVQPTAETWVLEDSAGARVTSRPVSYQGAMGMENERYAARFSLSFRHAITKDLTWLRLTRATDGTRLEWTFPGGTSAPGAATSESAVPDAAWRDDARPVAARLPQAQPLYHPRNPAPDAGLGDGSGGPTRPVNLLTHPEAAPALAPALPPEPGVEIAPPPALAPTPAIEPPAPPAPPAPVVEPPPAPAAPTNPPGSLPPPRSRRVP